MTYEHPGYIDTRRIRQYIESHPHLKVSDALRMFSGIELTPMQARVSKKTDNNRAVLETIPEQLEKRMQACWKEWPALIFRDEEHWKKIQVSPTIIKQVKHRLHDGWTMGYLSVTITRPLADKASFSKPDLVLQTFRKILGRDPTMKPDGSFPGYDYWRGIRATKSMSDPDFEIDFIHGIQDPELKAYWLRKRGITSAVAANT